MGFFPRTQIGATERIFSQAKSWNSSPRFGPQHSALAPQLPDCPTAPSAPSPPLPSGGFSQLPLQLEFLCCGQAQSFLLQVRGYSQVAAYLTLPPTAFGKSHTFRVSTGTTQLSTQDTWEAAAGAVAAAAGRILIPAV